MTNYLIGQSARNKRGRAEPLFHAVEWHLPRASRTGRNYLTVCGRSVANVRDEAFQGAPGRKCPVCMDQVVAR